jgi:hypothetical protein
VTERHATIDASTLGFYNPSYQPLISKSHPMARKKNGVSTFEEVRQLLKSNPEMPVKEVVSTSIHAPIHSEANGKL